MAETKTMADAALETLLIMVGRGDDDRAYDQAVAMARGAERPLCCPACGCQQFFVEQLTWNRQAYDAADPSGDCWGDTDHGGEYEDYPLKAVCQECERDCTRQLAARNVTCFYSDPVWNDDVNNPAPEGLQRRRGIEIGCGKAECGHCYEPKGVARG